MAKLIFFSLVVAQALVHTYARRVAYRVSQQSTPLVESDKLGLMLTHALHINIHS